MDPHTGLVWGYSRVPLFSFTFFFSTYFIYIY
jgi:hypothetical protein